MSRANTCELASFVCRASISCLILSCSASNTFLSGLPLVATSSCSCFSTGVAVPLVEAGATLAFAGAPFVVAVFCTAIVISRGDIKNNFGDEGTARKAETSSFGCKVVSGEIASDFTWPCESLPTLSYHPPHKFSSFQSIQKSDQ